MSISVAVKYVQSIGIIMAFCMPGGLVKILSAWGGDRRNCWIVVCNGGSVHSTQAATRLYARLTWMTCGLDRPDALCETDLDVLVFFLWLVKSLKNL